MPNVCQNGLTLCDPAMNKWAKDRTYRENLFLNIVASLLGSLKVLFWVPSSFHCYPLARLFLPPQWRWHSTNSVFFPVWNPGGSAELCMSVSVDVCTVLTRLSCSSFQGRNLPSLTWTARNLGVILDDQLSFAANIPATTHSCRFILHNIRRIHLFLIQEAELFLVQTLVISRLEYCNLLLAGVPACAIQPLQLIQNAAARWVFNLPKFSHATPLLCTQHWLPVAARFWFKTLALAVNDSGPSYMQDLFKPYIPTRPLCSATARRCATPSLRGGPSCRSSKSRLFAVLAPQWWNELPIDIRTADTVHIFCCRLKTHLFRLLLVSWKKKNNLLICV